nr:hypothetical protein [Bacilli bacterium]
MKIEEGKLYFIKDKYFELFKNEHLMQNKENGNKRPCYLCFRDEKNPIILWFIPISHKVDKYKLLYKQKKKNHKTVLNFVFGNILNEEKAFLIQNIFPVTEQYIIGKYVNKRKDVEINYELKNKIISYAKELIKLTEERYHKIAFNDIIKMKNILLEENTINV